MEILPFSTTWINPEDITLSEISQKTNTLRFHLHEASKVGKLAETIQYWFQQLGRGGNGELLYNWFKVSVILDE